MILPAAAVSQNDRLGLTIFLAVCLHAIIILGISFGFSDSTPELSAEDLEITIVDTQSIEAPDEADVRAQTQQVGGGEDDEFNRPSSPFANPVPSNTDGIAPHSKMENTPPSLDKAEQQTEILTVKESDVFMDTQEFAQDIPFATETKEAAVIIEQSRNYARVSAQLDRVNHSMQRHTYVTGVNAQQYVLASYITGWRTRLEEYGTINHPDYIVTKKINATVILDVAIRTDGSLDSVTIKRSSGHPELDREVKKMAISAAPYAPLPQEIRESTDILHIELQWNFKYKDGKVYSSRK